MATSDSDVYGQGMTTRSRIWLVAVLVVAAVAVAVFVYWDRQRDAKRLEAEMFCMMDETIPSLYSPEFKNCVDQYVD